MQSVVTVDGFLETKVTAAIFDGFLDTESDDKLAGTYALGNSGYFVATIGNAKIGDGIAVEIYLVTR